MKPVLRAQWSSGAIGRYRARVNKDMGMAVEASLKRIQADWAAHVRVDTGHYQETILSAEPVMVTPTNGYIEPSPFEVYFAVNEYGGPTMGPNPAKDQAIAKESAQLRATLDAVLRGALGG